MNYLHDKRNKEKKTMFLPLVIGVLVIALIFGVRVIYKGTSSVTLGAARPLWSLRTSFKEKIHSYRAYFVSKKELQKEVDLLRIENSKFKLGVVDRNALDDENTKLKEILNRKKNISTLLGVVIARPGQSLYDTLIVDVGRDHNVSVGAKVFVEGETLVGYVEEVYDKTAKVVLYSAPGQVVEALSSPGDVPLSMQGRGGGNFEIELPRDVELLIGSSVVFPDIHPYVLGTIGDVTFDPRDPFQTVLVSLPINIQHIKFVEIQLESDKPQMDTDEMQINTES